jgi:hypothetical protein
MARESKGKAGGRTGSAAAPPCRGRKGEEEERKGKTEADRWDPPVGAAVKRKGKGGKRWAGGEDWAGPFGPKEWLGLFVFFLFFFKLHFHIQFQLKFKSNFCKFLSKIL